MRCFGIKFILFASVLLCCCKQNAEEITEINSINLALNALDKADADTLVVFDVGEMLYILQNNLYRLLRNPRIFDNDDVIYVENLMSEFKKSDPNWKVKIKSSIMLNCSPELVEKSVVSIIKKLQSNHVKAIALCSANPGQCGVIESMRDWRFSILKSLEIDFSSSFKQQHIVFDNLDFYDGDYPEYYKGILFGASHLPSGHNPKGLTLCAFFDAVNWTPKNVIIFDDCKDYLINIAGELEKKKISSQCFGYNLTSKHSPKINRDIVNLQIKYIKQGVFLSDQEAENLFMSED